MANGSPRANRRSPSPPKPAWSTPRRIANSESHLRVELETSLKRLNRDHVELFHLHRREHARPLEEVVGTVARLIKDGKIGGYGLSEVAPDTLRRAQAVHPCTAIQNEYWLWSRLPELGMIQTCADLGVAFIPFSPLARGMLGDRPIAPPTDRFRATNPCFTEPNFTANIPKINTFRAFCAAGGWSAPATALAWVLSHGNHLIPIFGTRSASNLRQSTAGARITLTPEDHAEINRILPAGFAYGDLYGDHQTQAVERYC